MHGYYELIMETSGTRVLTRFARYCTHGLEQTYPRKGDLLELVDPATLLPTQQFRVLAAQINEQDVTTSLELDHPLPETAVGWYLCNLSQSPSFRFIRCTIQNVIAMGIRLHTKNSAIESCCIENSSLAAINICVEPTWYESGAAENVVIRNNRLIRCGKTSFHDGQTCGVIIYSEIENPVPIHKNIRILDNEIEPHPGQSAMKLSCVEGLTVRGNRGGKIEISNCRQVDTD